MPGSETQVDRIRRTVHFSGRVQGVGFRFTTESIACDHEVVGFVRNLTDGRVEVVVEGSRTEVDGFLRAIDHAMSTRIQEHTVDESPATGEFTSFRITY